MPISPMTFSSVSTDVGNGIRILGIDPGSQITGVGVIDVDVDRAALVHWEAIKAGGREHHARLQVIFEAVAGLVKAYQPKEIAIERVFMHRNPDSALKLGQARAAALCATFDSGAPVHEYAARQVKQSVAGYGAADKSQVQHMVKLLLNMDSAVQADAADALAIALCHAHLRRASDMIKQAANR
jgi:crossover junction endodeoxyribonuclease RuvC